MARDQREPGAPHTLQVDGKSGTVDLCDVHSKELLAPLLDIIAPVRATGSGSGRKTEPGEATCILCATSLRTDRVAAHLNNRHHSSLENVYGLACPLCDTETATINGLGMHARMAHSLPNVAALWVQVEKDGDPRGRLAERRALLLATS
jgi:hypothetical protein